MSEIRPAFVHPVLSLHTPVATACRTFGISRKTGHQWLRRYRARPEQPLVDGSRRPHFDPRRTAADLETAIRRSALRRDQLA